MMQKETILHQFTTQGYVMIEGLLDPEQDLQPVVDDYTILLDEVAERWYTQGNISSTYRDSSFSERMIHLINDFGDNWAPYFDISLPNGNVTEESPIHLSEAVFNLLRNPRLLDVVELLIGPEIYSNPIQHVRIKPPQRMLAQDKQVDGMTALTPWHQDQGAALPEADDTEMLTVWFPITDALEEHGCLQVVPGNYNELLTHCPVLHIPEQLLGQEPVTVQMRRGSVLCMHRRTPHASVPNVSNQIRWSFDLRYQPTHQPTGRPKFPGFIVRSQEEPERVLNDFHTWAQLWRDARTRLAQDDSLEFHRWDGSQPICA